MIEVYLLHLKLIKTEKNIHLAMEYASPTCLNTFIRGRPFKRINEDEAKVIFK
jgi:MAP/microtubule affinity-regulating kinase